MTIETINKLFLNSINFKRAGNNEYVMYMPFYYLNTVENMPLYIKIVDEEVTLTDLGAFIDKLEDEHKDLEKGKNKLNAVLKRYNMTLSNGTLSMKCPIQHAHIYISYYFQALTLIYNLL